MKLKKSLTAEEKEKFYDEKIAPQLAKLGKMCQDHGLSFLAGVEWEPGEIGRTYTSPGGASEAILRANATLQGEFGVGAIAITVTNKK